MDDSLLPELEYIGVLIDGIRWHWDYLNTPYAPLGFEPAPFYLPWLINYLGESVRDDEYFRRAALKNPALMPLPITGFVQVLRDLAHEQLSDSDNQALMRAGIKRMAARTAHDLAEKASGGPLSEAELNALGWHLTTLVALGSDSLKAALLSLQVKGGVKSGESRRAENADRDRAICDAGKRLIAEGRAVRSLAGIISDTAAAEGLTAKRVRTILRAGGVVPASSKKREAN